jgi:hypothetical protein
VLGGRVIQRSKVVSMSRSGCTAAMFVFMKRWWLLGLSHRGWWRLKSPSIIRPVVLLVLWFWASRWRARNISVSWWLPSLYML